MNDDRNLDHLTFYETRLKGKNEMFFESTLGYNSGMGDIARTREGVTILLKEELKGKKGVQA